MHFQCYCLYSFPKSAFLYKKDFFQQTAMKTFKYFLKLALLCGNNSEKTTQVNLLIYIKFKQFFDDITVAVQMWLNIFYYISIRSTSSIAILWVHVSDLNKMYPHLRNTCVSKILVKYMAYSHFNLSLYFLHVYSG